ncbi:Transcriptional regulator, TetR family [Streptococcus sp. DD11]|uniref:TetR/AcrR family transcriptional regulator n=1 Tax=Streptococcus sp. DD11 TaxID=1777879 RepID=UPI00079C24B3|nr:TetR family transcriptional regulator [Streptococcus sp. DD11]KXT78931.1 Transcriptional regulator, TetR family [Streptococcus sp. DD11]
MDRRIQRSRQAILDAFTELLAASSFEQIRIKDILERANVGRATFYNHFESKEMLLEEFSLSLFQHIFEEGIAYDHFINLLEHLFQHIGDSAPMRQLLVSKQAYFLREFQLHLEIYLWPKLKPLFQTKSSPLPESFLQEQALSSFMATLDWWLPRLAAYSSQDVSRIYLAYLANLLQEEEL